MQEVQAIVLALESHDSTVCERLDSLSLIILCSIFLYSQECLSQQRGLYLLAVSFRQPCDSIVSYYGQRVLSRNARDTAQEVALKQRKKLEIGKVALTQLLKGFVKTDTSNKLRRWVRVAHRPEGF